jgi:hypothetical protein
VGPRQQISKTGFNRGLNFQKGFNRKSEAQGRRGGTVVDNTEDFDVFGIEDDYYIPVIHIYYKDDLTVA